jgi:predicted nucleic acid-binding protein
VAASTFILDASTALAWMFRRVKRDEDRLANEALLRIQKSGGVVPALWFPEIANGILVAERLVAVPIHTSASFLGLVETLPIEQDKVHPSSVFATILSLARSHGLTSYDATYLELVLRTGGILATFDGQLAEAVRRAGGRVFGDAEYDVP